VTFVSTNASSYTVNSATQITATAPAGTVNTTVDVTVANASGTSATGAGSKFFYAPAPTVTGLSVVNGPTGGGTSVVITGTNFQGSAPSWAASAVKFGAANASSFTVDSSTQITATAPAASASTVDVTVVAPGGTSATSSADQYTYVAAPTVTGVNPNQGPTTAGIVVSITGTNFTGFVGTPSVVFGTNAATTVTVIDATHINATAPAGTGTVDVRVTTPGGQSAVVAADHYTYVAAPPDRWRNEVHDHRLELQRFHRGAERQCRWRAGDQRDRRRRNAHHRDHAGGPGRSDPCPGHDAGRHFEQRCEQ
jgi:hypothetical protein